MKILFCIGSLNKGGAERVMTNLANFLVTDNEIGIVMTINETPKYELNEKIKIYTLQKKEKESKNILLKNAKRLKYLNNIVKEFKADVIVSFLPGPSYRVLALKKLNKVPVIVSVRNDPKIEYKSFMNKLIMKMLYPLADGFVFQTEEAKEYFSKKIQAKSIIIPNPIKEEFVNRPIYMEKREKTIVAVGRLETQKNHNLLIEAYQLIQDKIPEYKVMIYGEGSLRKKLEEKIESLKLNNKVILQGEKNNILDEIEKAGLFVLSSNFEGMPNALMEAMALGIPCIATDCPCGGCRFLIKNGENGILVPIESKEALANAIVSVLSSEKLQKEIGDKASKIRDSLNPIVINNSWKLYIDKVLGVNHGN